MNHLYVRKGPPIAYSLADKASYNDSVGGSELLAEATAGMLEPDPPRRTLTFAEQLELVASGQRRIVNVIPIRKPDPDMTLGGVAWA